MVVKGKEELFGGDLVQSVDADVVVGVGGVINRKDIAKGLRSIRWRLVRHV